MNRFFLGVLFTAHCSLLTAQVAVKYTGPGAAAGRRTEPSAYRVPSGFTDTYEAGSTLTLNGTLAGTPTGGSLDLRNLSLQLLATQVTNTPAGNLSATTVQAALDELDTEKETPAGAQSKANAAQAAAEATAASALATHTGNTSNPHSVTAAQVGLGNVTNHAQTQAAVVPNTAPTAGQLLVGNAGGTAYSPVSASGDVALASNGAMTVQADSVALGTDTTGDYVATIAGDTEITVGGSGTESRAVTLAIGSAIARDSEVTAALEAEVTATRTLTGKTIDGDDNTVQDLAVGAIKASTLIIASEGIGSNNNDTTLPTSAAVKAYADTAASTAAAAVISDTAYDATSWNGDTTRGPSKNAVRDQFEAEVTATRTLTGKTIDGDDNTVQDLTVAAIKASTLIIASEGIGSNNNDTTLPTSAAVKAYADGALAAFTGTSNLVTTGALNSGSITSGFGSINVGSDSITGGAGSFTTVGTTGDITIATSANLAFGSPNDAIAFSAGELRFYAGGPQRMALSSSTGALSATGAVQFSNYGAGTATFDSSGNISSTSDARRKDIQGPYTKGLAELRKVTPVLWRYKADTGLVPTDQHAGPTAQDLLQAGLTEAVYDYRTVADTETITEQVEELVDTGTMTKGDFARGILPQPILETRTVERTREVQKRDAQGRGLTKQVAATSYSVDQGPIIAALINAVKELAEQNDALAARVQALEASR